MAKYRLDWSVYRDKVLAGWVGKSIGGIVGMHLENQKFWHDLTVDRLWPATVGPNDDLDIQVVWLEALQERGLYLTSTDLEEFWRDRCWYNFCEYGYFLYNAERGISAPTSGVWNNTFFWESEGCPIRSEIWSLVCPGNPALAAQFAKYDGQLDHGGNSVLIEMFLAAAGAQAFVSNDLEDVLSAGLSVIPAESAPAKAVSFVREVCKKYPEPAKAWRMIVREYGDRDASKAMMNHAIVLMSLFLGQRDFEQTMLICANAGWDTDCTAATAGALLGIMDGMRTMPKVWLEKLGTTLICGVEVKHKNATLESFTDDTAKIGVEMARARNEMIEIAGGPNVVVRPAPKPAIAIAVEYAEKPVLWNRRPTTVNVVIDNPLGESRGELRVVGGSDLKIALNSPTVLKSGRTNVSVTIQREKPDTWLADTNLFTAEWVEAGKVVASRVFGLNGARQWLVYGPYWMAWDKTRNPICPYYNDTKITHPCHVGYAEDSYNHFVPVDQAYLDEAALLRGELPEELPMVLESGEDCLTEKDLDKFHGQGCYYLVRTFQASQPGGNRPIGLMLGYMAAYRLWIDGKEMAAAATGPLAWGPGHINARIPLTGQPQRMVVKVTKPGDTFQFSCTPICCNFEEDRFHGRSAYLTNLSDLPPTCGV